MTWREVDLWLAAQATTEMQREAARSLVLMVKDREWDVFYSQTFRPQSSLAGAHALLAHSLAVLRSSLTAMEAFVAWERRSESGDPGWHAHTLLTLSKRSVCAPCRSDWKHCGQPFFRWEPFSRSFRWLPATKASVDEWKTRSRGCTMHCIRCVKTEEILARIIGWARIEPIRSREAAAVGYCLKYVCKTAPRHDVDMECTWEYVDIRQDKALPPYWVPGRDPDPTAQQPLPHME